MFIDFTISQTGMIRHWRRERSPGWRRRLSINAFGAVLTAVVAVVVTVAKAPPSLLVLILIPVFVGVMTFIHRQYQGQEEELHVREDLVIEGAHREQRVVVPVNGINRAVVQAVVFGRTLANDVRAVYVTEDPEPARSSEAVGAPVPGRPARHRRVAVPGADRSGHRLPRRPRPRLAARQARPDHDRRPARVRRPALVGPAAV